MGKSIEHRGRGIRLAGKGDEAVLTIDGEVVRWGRFSGDGEYFLYRYAYDPHKSLLEVAKRYVEHRERAKGMREEDEG